MIAYVQLSCCPKDSYGEAQACTEPVEVKHKRKGQNLSVMP